MSFFVFAAYNALGIGYVCSIYGKVEEDLVAPLKKKMFSPGTVSVSRQGKLRVDEPNKRLQLFRMIAYTAFYIGWPIALFRDIFTQDFYEK